MSDEIKYLNNYGVHSRGKLYIVTPLIGESNIMPFIEVTYDKQKALDQATVRARRFGTGANVHEIDLNTLETSVIWVTVTEIKNA